MKIHITTSNIVYSAEPSNYAYSYRCHAVNDEYTLPDALTESANSTYPRTHTFHAMVSMNLAGRDTGLYLRTLEQYLNNNFNKRIPEESKIQAIHTAVINTINPSVSSSHPLDSIPEEETVDDNILCMVQKEIQAFLMQQIQKKHVPYTQAPRLMQPTHATLFFMARTGIDSFLSTLSDNKKSTSNHLALTHFRATQVSITPMTLMMFLKNELNALAYPEHNQTPRTPEESLMMCQQAITSLDAMLASPYLTNQVLANFIHTTSTHVQGLARAFKAQVNQEAEHVQRTGFGNGY
jgi:hypothetical protein